MRIIMSIACLFIASPSFAQNLCEKYQNNQRYLSAIETVAKSLDLQLEQLCALPKIWDIEAQPSRMISREGEVIPHVRVQLHMEYDSCLYMVRDSDQFISQQRCYSGF